MAKKKAKAVKRRTAKRIIKKKIIKQVKEIKIDLSTLKFCPDCSANNIFYSKTRDEIICRECGGIFSKLTPEQMAKYKDSLN